MAPMPGIRLPFNSASLWASTEDDLRILYRSEFTGAITTRTACSTDSGYAHDEKIHQHAFISSTSQDALPMPEPAHTGTTHPTTDSKKDVRGISTVNTLGYSPFSLRFYIETVRRIQATTTGPHKPVIFSVAGDVSTLIACYSLIVKHHDPKARPWEIWCMEINLSCPNVPGAPPPAYSQPELSFLLSELSDGIKSLLLRTKLDLEKLKMGENEIAETLQKFDIPVGLKLPPYTYKNQIDDLVENVRRVNDVFALNSKSSSYMSSTLASFRTNLSRHLRGAGDNIVGPYFQVGDTVDPSYLNQKPQLDLDKTLAEDLAVSLSLDDALSQAPSNAASDELGAVLRAPFPIAFLTSTNTLGSCLHLSETIEDDHTVYGQDRWHPTLSSTDGEGIGGLGGAALHFLALGNVRSLRRRLDLYESTKPMAIIGVGGVNDCNSFQRMKAAGADAVALATALGANGVDVFAEVAVSVDVTDR